jgi:hypothetical protein
MSSNSFGGPNIPEIVEHYQGLLERFHHGAPRLAVPAFMVERPGHFDSNGSEMTRSWLFQQWNRIAVAGRVVRLVVVEGSVRALRPDWTTCQQWVNALTACRNSGQKLYGYVPVNGGNRAVADVTAEISQWNTNVGTYLDGIYLDEGPTSCAPHVAANYRAYSQAVRGLGLGLFILAAQWPGYPDTWLQQLDPDFVQLWEEGVVPYRTQYGALDYCIAQRPVIPPPRWWTQVGYGARRIHTVNDCGDAAVMQQLLGEAFDKFALTVWITRARVDPQLGSVYDELPPYWDDMVNLINSNPGVGP